MCTHMYCMKPCKKMDLFLYKLRKRAKRKLAALSMNTVRLVVSKQKIPLTQNIVERQLEYIMKDVEEVMLNPDDL